MNPQAVLSPDHITKSFEAATDLVKQLLTLSTGIVALTLSFLKDVMRSVPPRTGWIIRLAWLLHGLSVAFGVLALMAIVGTYGTTIPADGIYHANITLWVGLQIIAFGLATALVVVFGYRAFAVKPAPPATLSPPPAPGAGVSARVTDLQRLVDEGRTAEARALLATLRREAPQDAAVVQWSKVLGKPSAAVVTPRHPVGVGDTIAWLREHGSAYDGQWVALRGGELLGSSRDRAELRRKLEAEDRLAGATFVCIGEPAR